MKPSPDQHKRIVAWCRSKGVPISARRAYMGYRAGGRICVARHFRMDDMLHEAAHWLVATPERRLLTNFGLGPDPDAVYFSEAVIRSDAAQVEEEIVSLIGIGILHHLFNDTERTQVALCHHDWPSQNPKRTKRRIRQAKKHVACDNDIRMALRVIGKIHSDLHDQNERRIAARRDARLTRSS